MASVYTNDLRLEEIGSGEQSGTWGDTTNTNLELIAESFSFGTEAITTNADTHTTTIADGATDPGRSMFLKYTGTLDSACTITIGPNTVSKLWFIENGTSGSQNIIIKQGSGATITIPPGDTKAIYSDGAGSGGKMVDAFASLSVVDLKVQDDLTFSSDSAVISFGADADTTLTHTDGSGLTLNSTNKLMFNDASQFIQGSSATVLSIAATDEIDLTATAIDLNGTLDVSGTALVTGVLTTTAATVFNGGFASNADSTMATNKKLIFRDAAIHISSVNDGDLMIVADDEIDITSTLIDINGNVEISGTLAQADAITMATNKKIIFRDAAIHISSTADGDMSIAADDEIDITSTLIDINGAVDMSSTLGVTGKITADAGIDIDNFNIDGTTIALSSGDMTLDAAGDITLDADGGDVFFKDGGTEYARFTQNSGGLRIQTVSNNADFIVLGNDGGVDVAAMTLDMSAAGAATFSGNVTAFSDKRLKSDIQTLENGLEKVEQLRGVTYIRDDNVDGGQQIGVIAQEVEEVFPQVVLTADDERGTKSVDYGKLTGALIEAVKELSAKVKELEGRLDGSTE